MDSQTPQVFQYHRDLKDDFMNLECCEDPWSVVVQDFALLGNFPKGIDPMFFSSNNAGRFDNSDITFNFYNPQNSFPWIRAGGFEFHRAKNYFIIGGPTFLELSDAVESVYDLQGSFENSVRFNQKDRMSRDDYETLHEFAGEIYGQRIIYNSKAFKKFRSILSQFAKFDCLDRFGFLG